MSAPRLDLSLYGLDRFGPDDVVAEPFPHIFVPGNAVDESAYQYLHDRYPPLEFFLAGRRFGDNHKIHCGSRRAQEGGGIDPCWGELARNVLASDALGQFMGIFSPWVEQEHPEFAARFRQGGLKISNRDDPAAADLNIEQQVNMHTPTTGSVARHERGPHVKTCTKLFICMLFMPVEPAAVAGGDLVACRRRPGNTRPFGKSQALAREDVEEVDRLPYARNSMLIFMNSPRSIVYNVPREPGPEPMRYLHCIVESRTPLFDLPRDPATEAMWRRLARPVRAAWWRLSGRHPGYVS